MGWGSFYRSQDLWKILNQTDTTDIVAKQQPKVKLVKSHQPFSKGFLSQEKATVNSFHLENTLDRIE